MCDGLDLPVLGIWAGHYLFSNTWRVTRVMSAMRPRRRPDQREERKSFNVLVWGASAIHQDGLT